jgi:hypothetical protein
MRLYSDMIRHRQLANYDTTFDEISRDTSGALNTRWLRRVNSSLARLLTLALAYNRHVLFRENNDRWCHLKSTRRTKKPGMKSD